MTGLILSALWVRFVAILPVFHPNIWSPHMAFALITSMVERLRSGAHFCVQRKKITTIHSSAQTGKTIDRSGISPHPLQVNTASEIRDQSHPTSTRTVEASGSRRFPSDLTEKTTSFKQNQATSLTKLKAAPARSPVRCVRSKTGRMVLSGRMADVCAELERMAAHESLAPAPH